MKTFVIIGLSTFGQYMAEFLSARKFDVVAIDADENRVENVKSFVKKGIIADATKKNTLKDLGINEADAVIVSLGDYIDASLLVVLYLKVIGIKEIYVKVLTEDHAKILNIVGVTEVIFPEKDSAYNLSQRIDNANIMDYIPLIEGYSIIDLAPPSQFLGKSLQQVDLRNIYDVQVILIKEILQETTVIFPRGDYIIKDSDVLVVMGKNESIEKLRKQT